MKLTKKEQNINYFSFSAIGGKTKQVASASRSFILYPKFILFLLIITFIFLLLRVYFSNQLAVSGGFVSINSSRITQLTKENYNLENKLSQLSSLGYIESQTERLGMVKIAKVEVLKGSGGVALNQ